jgi:hypothetical protein
MEVNLAGSGVGGGMASIDGELPPTALAIPAVEIGDQPQASLEETPQLRHAEFFAALRRLGARSGLPRTDNSSTRRERQNCRVFVSCPQDLWIETFGKPRNITQHYDLAMHLSFQAWHQTSADGPLTCVGHLFERSPGVPWVTVSRIIW